MITKQELEDMEAMSPLLKDFLINSISEGVQQMAEVIEVGKKDYDYFFKQLGDSEVKEMYKFLSEVALPLFDENEMYERSAKAKNMCDLLTKYRGLKK